MAPYVTWMSDYMQARLADRGDVMKKVIASIWLADKTDDLEQLCDDIIDDIIRLYLSNVFRDKQGSPDAIRFLVAEEGMDRIMNGLSTAPFRSALLATVKEVTESNK